MRDHFVPVKTRDPSAHCAICKRPSSPTAVPVIWLPYTPISTNYSVWSSKSSGLQVFNARPFPCRLHRLTHESWCKYVDKYVFVAHFRHHAYQSVAPSNLSVFRDRLRVLDPDESHRGKECQRDSQGEFPHIDDDAILQQSTNLKSSTFQELNSDGKCATGLLYSRIYISLSVRPRKRAALEYYSSQHR